MRNAILSEALIIKITSPLKSTSIVPHAAASMTCRNGHALIAALSGYPQYNCDICNSGARPDDLHFACRVCKYVRTELIDGSPG